MRRPQNRYGFLDKAGHVVVPPQFLQVHPFYRGIAAVRVFGSGEWGFINRTGQWVHEPEFQEAELPCCRKPDCAEADGWWIVYARGRGYGYHLVCGALQEVRRLNLTVEPECGFVREVINSRPEFKDLLV